MEGRVYLGMLCSCSEIFSLCFGDGFITLCNKVPALTAFDFQKVVNQLANDCFDDMITIYPTIGQDCETPFLIREER